MRNLPSASSREKPSVVCVRSFVPKEKKSAYLGDLVRRGRTRAAARSSCRTRYSTSGASSAMTRSVSSRSRRSSSREADERVHDLDERRVAGALLHRARPRGRSRAPASRRSPATGCPSRQPRVPSIGFASCERLDPLAHPLVGRLLERRQELVQRRVEQPDRHRQARPSPRRSPRSRTAGTAAAGRARRGGPSSSAARIISCTTGSRSSPKNMCSVRQRPMPCGAELARLARRPRACRRSRAP